MPENPSANRRIAIALAIATLLLAVLALRPGLGGGFIFDDTPNLTRNHGLTASDLSIDGFLQATFSSVAGPLRRPVSMATFWVNNVLSGMDPWWFRFTNMLVHLATAVAWMFATRAILAASHTRPTGTLAPLLPVLVGAVWLLHPLNMSPALYIVQRMTSLSALFTAIGVALYCHGRLRLHQNRNGWPAILGGALACTIVAALAKENGVLLPLLLAVTEFLLISRPGDRHKRRILALFGVVLVIPGCIVLAGLAMKPEFIASTYVTRDFSMIERLMSEARILWHYLSWYAWPDITRLGIFHDDFKVSQGPLEPPTTLLAILGWIATAVAALISARRYPWLSFAAFWFLASHLLESTALGLELIHEHRMYVASFGLSLAAFAVLLPLGERRLGPRLTAAGCVLLVLVLAALLNIRATQWGDPRTFMAIEVLHHPDSPRANADLAGILYRLYADGDDAVPENVCLLMQKHWRKAIELDPGMVYPFSGLLAIEQTCGFERSPEFLDAMLVRVRYRPALLGTVLGNLVSLTARGRVDLDPAFMEAVFNAAFENPSTSPPRRAVLLAVLGKYYSSVLMRPDRGIPLLIAAVETNPGSLRLRLDLSLTALSFDNPQLAWAHLQEARRRDSLGAYAAEIDEQIQQLRGAYPVGEWNP